MKTATVLQGKTWDVRQQLKRWGFIFNEEHKVWVRFSSAHNNPPDHELGQLVSRMKGLNLYICDPSPYEKALIRQQTARNSGSQSRDQAYKD